MMVLITSEVINLLRGKCKIEDDKSLNGRPFPEEESSITTTGQPVDAPTTAQHDCPVQFSQCKE